MAGKSKKNNQDKNNDKIKWKRPFDHKINSLPSKQIGFK